MPIIYFDNFRGFEKTFIPLKDINFFVGENSTGKTSVLKLIKIVADPKFWFMQDFNNQETDLGYFSDIAGHSNQKKKYFEIGIMGESTYNDKNISAIKLKFFEKDSLPELREMSIIDEKINIQAIIEGDSIKYRFVFNNSIDYSLSFFKEWVDNSRLTNNFKKQKLDKSSYINTMFFQVDNIIRKEIQKAKKNKKETSNGISFPDFLRDVAWLAPIRTEPKRTYDNYKTKFNPDGTHAPYTLKNLLAKDKNSNKKETVERILEKFGEDSGLFEKIKIVNLGRNDTSPFEIHIVINGKPLKITNVGYGVSQIFPIIVEIISRPENSWFAIQQPEIHLHPKGQAAFGDFMFKSFLMESKCFIIETHSDYTIDRFRLKMNKHHKQKGKNPDSQIVFFNRISIGNSLECISINDDGSLSDNQPKEFREFFIREQLELLKV